MIAERTTNLDKQSTSQNKGNKDQKKTSQVNKTTEAPHYGGETKGHANGTLALQGCWKRWWGPRQTGFVSSRLPHTYCYSRHWSLYYVSVLLYWNIST